MPVVTAVAVTVAVNSAPGVRWQADRDRRRPGPKTGSGAAELRITRVFSCVARGFKARASFMFAGCCWWRSLAVDGGSGTSRGHGPVMRRPGSRRSGAVSRPSAHDARHLRALVLVTTLSPSTGPATAPCPAQTPPPNPTAAEPGDGRVLSRPSSRVHEPGTLTEAVALRSQTVLTGSGSHRSSYGGFGGGHPHFHPHAPDLQIRYPAALPA